MDVEDQFELMISDEWWPRFRPSRPVIVRYLSTRGITDHRFGIIGGAITDTETDEVLSEISIFASSGGPAIDHLSGVKVLAGELPLGRALLVNPMQSLPDWLK